MVKRSQKTGRQLAGLLVQVVARQMASRPAQLQRRGKPPQVQIRSEGLTNLQAWQTKGEAAAAAGASIDANGLSAAAGG